MEEDKKEEEVQEEIEVEYTTRLDYIQGAYFCLSAVDELDTAIMNKEDEKRVKRIRRKSIKILDDCLNEMYDELFDTDDEESN
jgi:hypothetical protein